MTGLMALSALSLEELKHEARFWHREYMRHIAACDDCLAGERCPVASYMAEAADDYGTRVMTAEGYWQ